MADDTSSDDLSLNNILNSGTTLFGDYLKSKGGGGVTAPAAAPKTNSPGVATTSSTSVLMWVLGIGGALVVLVLGIKLLK